MCHGGRGTVRTQKRGWRRLLGWRWLGSSGEGGTDGMGGRKRQGERCAAWGASGVVLSGGPDCRGQAPWEQRRGWEGGDRERWWRLRRSSRHTSQT